MNRYILKPKNHFHRLWVFTVGLTCFLLGLLTAIAINARSDDWTADDTTRQLIFTTVALTDIGQTLQIATRADEGYYEKWNKILPEHPTEDQVSGYGVVWLAGHYTAARLLPAKWRHTLQYASIAGHSLAILNNKREGLHVDSRVKPFIGLSLLSLALHKYTSNVSVEAGQGGAVIIYRKEL